MRLALFVTAVALLGTSAMAQNLNSDQERLKRLLEDRYGGGGSPAPVTRSPGGPVTRSPGAVNRAPAPAPAPPSQQGKTLNPDDFHWVRPDGTIDTRAGGRSDAAPHLIIPQPASPPPSAIAGLWQSAKDHVRALLGTKPVTIAQFRKEDRGSETPVYVARNQYVIQLRDGATPEQIDAMLQRFGLEVVKSVPDLGVLYVRRKESAEPRAATRSVRRPESLGQLLEPKIIRELREDPAVEGAFVSSGVKSNSVPPPVKTSAALDGVSFNWNWKTNATDDGNWGLKIMRMPTVWTIVNRYRKLHPNTVKPQIAFVDSGFGTHSNLHYGNVQGGMPPKPLVANCQYSHGTHVAGIVAAIQNNGVGIDGIVPNATFDALPIGSGLLQEATEVGIDEEMLQRTMLFADVVGDTTFYLLQNPVAQGQRRVINISLGYNWYEGGGLSPGKLPESDDRITANILEHAKLVRRFADLFKNDVLIVVAAGNDSAYLDAPLEARWASPFAWAATNKSAVTKPAENIITVEAFGRDLKRASFSNVGGAIAAPGVNIMSTLTGSQETYGVCTGTSQASPHVAALAALMFELAPTKTPAEIAKVITESALPAVADTGGAARVDALDAVLKVSPESIHLLADLNEDGKVDAADLEIFKTHLTILQTARAAGGPISADLNGDGKIDANESCWPLIDLNGSGQASVDSIDLRPILGMPRSDLQVLEAGWTDEAKPFKTALAESGLDQMIMQWRSTGLVAATGTAMPKLTCDH
ncbi:MAG: S8 family serine peptidase [Hyphomicrobiaceae bacterium]